MEDFLHEFMTQLYPILATALVTVISALLLMLRKWVASKTDNETALIAMDQFQNVVDAVVTQIAEDVKRETSPDDDTPGEITKEEALLIKSNALATLREQIPPSVRKLMENIVGDIDQWLSGLIENSIRLGNISYRN